MSDPTPITRISALSLERVKVEVAATVNGVAYNPTVDTVVMAFKRPKDTPDTADWKTASWETIAGKYYARALVGPGGVIELTAGRWDVWVKVTDNPEVPVKDAGQIEVY